MPATTPKRVYPYPLDAEAADGPLGFQNLAVAIENDVDRWFAPPVRPYNTHYRTFAAAGPSTGGTWRTALMMDMGTVPAGRYDIFCNALLATQGNAAFGPSLVVGGTSEAPGTGALSVLVGVATAPASYTVMAQRCHDHPGGTLAIWASYGWIAAGGSVDLKGGQITVTFVHPL